jgi:hypothetical protein
MATISNVKVGKPDTSPSLPSHTRGTKEGNGSGALEKEPGFYQDGNMTKSTPRRSTGVGAEHRKPIDPRMPCLSPP